jgi:hypothetical protein
MLILAIYKTKKFKLINLITKLKTINLITKFKTIKVQESINLQKSCKIS